MKKRKLRVGLLLDGYEVSAWLYKMLENIIGSDYAELSLVVLHDLPQVPPNKTIFSKLRNNRGRIGYLLIRKSLELLYSKLVERNTYLPDAFEQRDCHALLSHIPAIRVSTIRKKWFDTFRAEDVTTIREYRIDILIRCGFGILKGDILTAAKYGIWSFHHGDNQVNRGGPAGFWESMESWPETGSILQILTEDLDNGMVLYRSFSCTNPLSCKDNSSNYFWKSLSFMTRKMKELHDLGEERFFEKVAYDNRHPLFYSERLYRSPTNYELARLTFRKIGEKARHLYENQRYFNQWILLYHLKDEFSSSLWRYKKIFPPADRFWADPHIVYRDSRYYVFIEEYLYDVKKGHIAVLVMDPAGSFDKPVQVLERPYHLSYPFVFQHEGEYYMIPESMENRTIELYRCVEFPNRWEHHMNLMENVTAVDATLHHSGGTWWMFVNMVENEGASSWDELFLFSSPVLFSNRWRPHPQNPIVSDCRASRPAGRIFTENGRLYRPSQNCSTRYGYGFNLSEITSLEEERYAEVVVSSVGPNWDRSIIGTHTFNRVNSLHMIDGLYRRRK